MVKNSPKIELFSDLLENLHTSQFEDVESEFDIDDLKLYLKSVFGQIGLKIKNSSDILENLHSRYFEGVEYIYAFHDVYIIWD